VIDRLFMYALLLGLVFVVVGIVSSTLDARYPPDCYQLCHSRGAIRWANVPGVGCVCDGKH
jgi:hypothetical protein